MSSKRGRRNTNPEDAQEPRAQAEDPATPAPAEDASNEEEATVKKPKASTDAWAAFAGGLMAPDAPSNGKTAEHRSETGGGQPQPSVTGFVISSKLIGTGKDEKMQINLAIDTWRHNGTKDAAISENGKTALLLATEKRPHAVYGVEPTRQTPRGTVPSRKPRNIAWINGSPQLLVTGATISVTLPKGGDRPDESKGTAAAAFAAHAAKDVGGLLPKVGAKVTIDGISMNWFQKEGKTSAAYINGDRLTLDIPAPTGKSRLEILEEISKNKTVAYNNTMAVLASCDKFQLPVGDGGIGDEAKILKTMYEEHTRGLIAAVRSLARGPFSVYEESYANALGERDNGEHLVELRASLEKLADMAEANGGCFSDRSEPGEDGTTKLLPSTVFFVNNLDANSVVKTAQGIVQDAIVMPRFVSDLYQGVLDKQAGLLFGMSTVSTSQGNLRKTSCFPWMCPRIESAKASLGVDPLAPVILTTRHTVRADERSHIPTCGVASAGFKASRAQLAEKLSCPDGKSLSVFEEEEAFVATAIAFHVYPKGETDSTIITTWPDMYEVFASESMESIGVQVPYDFIQEHYADADGFLTAGLDEGTAFKNPPIEMVNDSSIGKEFASKRVINLNYFTGRLKKVQEHPNVKYYIVGTGLRRNKAVKNYLGESTGAPVILDAANDLCEGDQPPDIKAFLAGCNAVPYAVVTD